MDAVSYSRASSAYKLAGQAIVGLTTKADLTTSGILVPMGTTATRPTLGAGEAAIRYNTDVGGLEEWNGTGWFNVSADITAVAIKGTDTVANILAKTGMVAEDLWIASDTLDGYVYDGSVWINIGPLQGPQGTAGISAYQVALNNGFVGTELQWLASLVGPQGIQGVTGNGIANVVKTSTVGLIDTYTITFTDTTTTTFNITNGLNGTNGVDGQDIDHVSKTAGTSAPGTTDTYTVWGDLGETINLGTFGVYNGVDGLGTGDMTKAIYDTTNNGVVDNAEKVNGLTVETAVPSGAVFTDTVYTHPDTDGSLHVPATGTTNSGKVLTAGATAGSMTWETPAPGVIDHGLLTGLVDDDHTQYHNDARGDIRYYIKSEVDTLLNAVATTGGVLPCPYEIDYSFSMTTADTSFGEIVAIYTLDSNRELFIFRNSATYKVYGAIYSKSTSTLGAETLICSGTTSYPQLVMSAVDATNFIYAICENGTTGLKAGILTISATDTNTVITVNASTSATLAGKLSNFGKLEKVGGAFILSYGRATTTSALRAMTISGTTVTIGAELVLSSAHTVPADLREYDGNMISFCANTTVINIDPISISGTTLTKGTGATVTTNQQSQWAYAGKFSDGRMAFVYINTYLYGAVITLSGTTVTISSAQMTTSSVTEVEEGFRTFDFSGTQKIILTDNDNSNATCNVLTNTSGTASAGVPIAGTIMGSFVYNGYLHIIHLNGYIAKIDVVGGNPVATDIGGYSAQSNTTTPYNPRYSSLYNMTTSILDAITDGNIYIKFNNIMFVDGIKDGKFAIFSNLTYGFARVGTCITNIDDSVTFGTRILTTTSRKIAKFKMKALV